MLVMKKKIIVLNFFYFINYHMIPYKNKFYYTENKNQPLLNLKIIYITCSELL